MGSLDVNAARGARAVPYLANVAANTLSPLSLQELGGVQPA